MISLNQFRLFTVLMLLAALVLPSALFAAETAPKRDALAVLNQMRLKRYTKDYELTEEQQKKVGAILEAESKEVSKLDGEPNLSISDRSARIRKLHDETYAKMKPLLTPAQLEKFEKALAKTAPKKK